MNRCYTLVLLLLVSHHFASAQIPGLEAKNWYFGAGTDGFVFDPSNIPYKVSNKYNGVGFEGIVVVNDPLSGSLLFYSDGQMVIDATHSIMFNGTGLFGHLSGAQTVQCVPMPNNPGKFYLLTSRAYDNGGDNLFYSIVDFTDPLYPLGKVTNKNTLLSAAIYGQANKVISKPNTTDYWWVGHLLNTNQYDVISITSSGFSAPVTYTATGTNSGDSYVMSHSPMANKIAVSGLAALGLVMMDFDNNTGALSNPLQIYSVPTGLGNFSPDGTKLYFLMNASGLQLHQYDLNTSTTVNMNTCCYDHDTKTGPDGKMYHITTYYSSTPIAVIDNPNLTAVGNACGYNALAPTILGAFNGQVRRFPEFVVLPQVPILGIEFTSFTAEALGEKVALRWTISQPCPACAFEVERGNGHGNYAVVGRISPSSNPTIAFQDQTVAQGHWYYRIKLIDGDGKFSYSEIKDVQIGNADDWALQIFPNPCFSELNLRFDVSNATSTKVEVIDLLGKKLLQATTSENFLKLDVASLAQGIYLLKLTAAGKTTYKKFEKE
jgi:hypothetical protein